MERGALHCVQRRRHLLADLLDGMTSGLPAAVQGMSGGRVRVCATARYRAANATSDRDVLGNVDDVEVRAAQLARKPQDNLEVLDGGPVGP